MRRKTGFIPILAAFLVLALPVAAQATTLIWAMEGDIQTVDDPLGLIGFAHSGDRVVYTFTFDSNAPDTNPSTSGGWYTGSSTTLEVGIQEVTSDFPYLEIQHDPSFHANDFFNVWSHLEVTGMPGSIYFRLLDPFGTGLTNISLPLEPYDLTAFAWTEFSATIIGPPSPNNPSGTLLSFNGSVDSFYAIAEPGSLLFVLGGLAFMLRRKKHG